MAATAAIIAATVVSAIGTGMSALSSSAQARNQAALSRSSASYAQAMANRNQQLANMQADRERAIGDYQAGMIREKAAKLLSRQRALYGASGVDLTGSPLEFMGTTYGEGERDALNAIMTGNYNAWRVNVGGETSLLEGGAAASRYNTEAGFYDSRATSALVAAPVMIGSSVLTGYGRYKMYGKYGAYDPYAFDPSR